MTKTIRVPEAFATRLLEVARQWDSSDTGGLNEYRCPDCGLLFHGRAVVFDGDLYRFDIDAKQFIKV